MFAQGLFVIYQGQLSRVIGRVKDNFIISNGFQYVIIPGSTYQIFTISKRAYND